MRATVERIIAGWESRRYEHYALRYQSSAVEIGARVPDSCVWIDGEPTDEVLPGACGLEIRPSVDLDDLMRAAEQYDYLGVPIVIAGDRMVYGEDDGEIIIADAVRVA